MNYKRNPNGTLLAIVYMLNKYFDIIKQYVYNFD